MNNSISKAKKISANSIYNCIVVILILVAVAIRGGATFEWLFPQEKPTYSLNDIQKIHSNASTLEVNADKTISIFDKNNILLAKGLFSGDFNTKFQGYAGITPLLIYINNDNTITDVQLLKNDESPDYIEHVIKKGLLNSWYRQTLDNLDILKL